MTGIAGKLTLFGLLLAAFACSTNQPVPKEPPAPVVQKANEPPVDGALGQQENSKTTYVIDQIIREKSRPIIEAIVKNDDKKAKLAYGRAVRVLPEVFQLAVDLRFRNYEHALSILPKTSLTDEQKVFWTKIISKKPAKLRVALCDELGANTSFPAPGSKAPEEEAVWLKYFDEVAKEIINAEAASKEPSEITKKLNKLSCSDKECSPIADDLREEILTDKFFDDIHNMRRRDTYFFAANYKSPLKLGQYRPLVSDMGLLRLYKALKITPYVKQIHFMRRFKSIARDMRPDTILSRSIGDIILENDKDLATARRFGTFLTSNSLISAVTRIENEIPSCQIK